MKRFLKTKHLCEILIYFVLIITQINAFEESIFEDEDIYRQALPPATASTGLTAPGTKWCGHGNTASSYEDLGSQRETDMCCRDHYHCETVLSHGSTLNGLTNTGLLPV